MASKASLLPAWPTTLTLTLTTLPTVDKTFTLMEDNIIDIIVHVAQYMRQQFKQRRCDHDLIERASSQLDLWNLSKLSTWIKLQTAQLPHLAAWCHNHPPVLLRDQGSPIKARSTVRCALQLCPTQTHHWSKLVLHFKFELIKVKAKTSHDSFIENE